jgi:uncharacterized membrane protein YhhN
MYFKIFLWVLLFLFSVGNIISLWKENKILEDVTKPFLMPILLLLYILSCSRPSIFIILALVFCFLGDTSLLGQGRFFVFGLLSFLVGHLFYIGAFLSFAKPFSFSPLVYFLFIFYVIYFIVIYRFLLPNLKDMKTAAFVYMAALLSMSYASLLYLAQGRLNAYPFFTFIGSVFFIFSDTQLALCEFNGRTKTEGRNKVQVLIIVTYIIAQVMIVFGTPGV